MLTNLLIILTIHFLEKEHKIHPIAIFNMHAIVIIAK